ncbi:alpha/beta hydrolase [Arthrobacter sp. MSA 4-2]|uniref:alpha/beta fold hydrolase n=1 Tax=Arthrobacter sp. MSA 4-2 TaxID=2794349 RepID=UPI0018E8D833|nr:alpha/beta hydrolase [Arthrobacter sp. MSA 4-2]MBJ2122659.1 alpha/beta hydrolase [Arthrobacter sp. MSA 4-2]
MPVFVLVHGLGMSHRYFAGLQSELDAYGETHVLDLPGFGGTPKPGRTLSIGDYADVIAEAMDAAQLSSCTLIGHSMGAQFVTELALRRPDLAAQVVLIGPVTDPGHASAFSHTLSLGLDTLLERPRTTLLAAGAYARCGLAWYFNELPVMLKYRLDRRLPLVTRPVLILRGTLDPIARRDWCARLADASRQSRLVEIPGQAHAAHRAGAAAVAAAITRFIDEHPRASALTTAPSNDLTSPRRVTTVQYTGRPQSRSAHTPGQISLTAGDWQARAHLIPHRPEAHAATEAGADERAVPVFVLIHGIGMSHRYLKRLGEQLSAHGRVVLLDLPGAGRTRTPTAKMPNAAKAEIIGDLLDEMGVSSCVVIGHSMGVQSATELALERPGLVSQLVLIGAAVDARRRTVPQQALTLTVNNVLEKSSLNFIQFTDMLRCGPRWYVAELDVAMNYPLEERLPLVEQPVLILRGSRDLVAGSAWSRALADTAVDGELVEVEGAFHGVHHSAAEAVTASITSFMTSSEDRFDEPEAA